MDRHSRYALLAGGLGLLLAVVPGCRTPRTEVPPDPGFSRQTTAAEQPGVGFSSSPPASPMNPMPNGLPGSGQVPGAVGNGAPSFSPNVPQAGPDVSGGDFSSNDISDQFSQPPGQMGEPGQPALPQ